METSGPTPPKHTQEEQTSIRVRKAMSLSQAPGRIERRGILLNELAEQHVDVQRLKGLIEQIRTDRDPEFELAQREPPPSAQEAH